MRYKTEPEAGSLQETCSPSWNEVPKSDSAKAWTSLRQIFGEENRKRDTGFPGIQHQAVRVTDPACRINIPRVKFRTN